MARALDLTLRRSHLICRFRHFRVAKLAGIDRKSHTFYPESCDEVGEVQILFHVFIEPSITRFQTQEVGW